MSLPEEILEKVFFELRIQIPKQAERTHAQLSADGLARQTLLAASQASRVTYRTARSALWHNIDSGLLDERNRLWLVLRTLSEQPKTAMLVREIVCTYSGTTKRGHSRYGTADQRYLTALLPAIRQNWLPTTLQADIVSAMADSNPDAELAILICMCKNVKTMLLGTPDDSLPPLSLRVCESILTQQSSTESDGRMITLPTALQHLHEIGLVRPRGELNLDPDQFERVLELDNLLRLLPALHSFQCSIDAVVNLKIPFTSRIRELFFNDVWISNEIWQPLLSACPELKELSILGSSNNDSDANWAVIGQCLRSSAAQLKILRIGIGGDHWGTSVFRGSIGSLAELRSLRELQLPVAAIVDTQQYSEQGSVQDIVVSTLREVLPTSLERLTIHHAKHHNDLLEGMAYGNYSYFEEGLDDFGPLGETEEHERLETETQMKNEADAFEVLLHAQFQQLIEDPLFQKLEYIGAHDHLPVTHSRLSPQPWVWRRD